MASLTAGILIFDYLVWIRKLHQPFFIVFAFDKIGF